MTFPVVAMDRSALLKGQPNGRLSPKILTTTPGQAAGATVVLIHPAARAWRALTAAAKTAGHTLKTSGVSNSYRVYEVQERIFRERYQLVPIPTSDTKRWQGRTWYKLPGVATAAAPGTSNHGWGSAVDAGEERDGDPGSEPFDDPTLRWLRDNLRAYGWSWEIQSEPWHLRYFAGDKIPQAVLDYEDSLTPTPPTRPPEDDDMRHLVKTDTGPRAGWWIITDGIHGRHVEDRLDARVQVNSKLCTAAGTDTKGDPIPHDWPAQAVNDLKIV